MTDFAASGDTAERIGRREIVLWISLAIIANQTLYEFDLGSVGGFLASLGNPNLVFWFACFVVVQLALDMDRTSQATRLDRLFVLGFGAILLATSMFGYRFGVGATATIAAVYCIRFWRGDRAMRAAGATLLALSAHLLWGPILFQTFLPVVLRVDTSLAGVVAHAIGSPAVAEGTSIYGLDGHRVAIVGGCSSFKNMSFAVLAYVSTVMLFRRKWIAADYFWLFAVCAAMVASNSVRLVILGTSLPLYEYWHNGPGVPILAVVQTAIIALVCVIALASTRSART